MSKKKKNNLLDPQLFKSISLGAVLAWVGLGSDGLSSSCYGPAQAFIALGEHHYLAFPLMLMMFFTIFILTASYSQGVELFPNRGGGYLVASKLLGAKAGLVSGSALLVDYVLTVAISITSGVEALFSLLPIEFQSYKMITIAFIIALMILINLRGVKESIIALLPIFLIFIISHFLLVVYGIVTQAEHLPEMITGSKKEFSSAIETGSLLALLLILFKAYSLGAGTFTGIEAVSNSTDILKEPKAQTAKKTLLYAGISLAVIAGGLFVNYMLFDLVEEPGKTMNATLLQRAWGSWEINGLPIGVGIVFITILSEGALLFVAAQTGYVGGPRVMANMALDGWLPRRFVNMSDRLVVGNGVIFMGIAAIAIIFLTGAKIKTLVILYSINVFVTFFLFTLGMSVHWGRRLNRGFKVWVKFLINNCGVLITGGTLVVIFVTRFYDGGWISLVINAGIIWICLKIKRHYNRVSQVIHRLKEVTDLTPLTHGQEDTSKPEPKKPTAIIMVKEFDGMGIHCIWNIIRLFGRNFRNFVFISTGILDYGQFKGVKEVHNLQKSTAESLKRYVKYCNDLGYYAEYRYKLGTDPLPELEQLCLEVAKEFPLGVFFGGQLIFDQESQFTRILHNNTSFELQRRLQFEGQQMVVLPIRISTLLTHQETLKENK